MKTTFADLKILFQDWRGLYLLGALSLLPFSNRAFFIDDHYHVLMAQGILAHPTRPYDFVSIDDGPGHKGWDPGEKPRMVNPPLFHYLLAVPLALGVKRVWALRLYTGLIAWTAVFFFWKLSARWCGRPRAAAWIVALTPAFFLSSYSLLIDGVLASFFLAALWTFVEQWEKPGWVWPVASGLLMSAATLTKYTAFLIVPVASLWWILYRRRLGDAPKLLTTFGILALAQGLWAVWNIHTYGSPHLTSASQRVVSADVAGWAKLIVIGTFFSGSFLFPVFSLALPIRHGPGKSLAVALVALSAVLGWALNGPQGGFSLWQSVLIGAFFLATLWFLVFVGFERARTGVKEDIFLFGWLFGGFVMMALVMGWVASRYFLLVLPPAVCLWVRQMEAWSPERAGRWLSATVVALGLGCLSLAYADYRQADVYRKAAHDLRVFDPLGAKGRYFLGDAFVGYTPYLEATGWKAAFPGDDLPIGSLLVRNEFTAPSWWSTPGTEGHELLGSVVYDASFPLRVMDLPASAGFYASAWGALPFSFSRRPWEVFHVYRVSHDTQTK